MHTGSITAVRAVDVTGDGVIDIVSSTSNAGTNFFTSVGTKRQTTSVQYLDILTAPNARATLTTLSSQLNRISTEIGRTGSFESRLEVTKNILQSTRENYLSAESRIKDADIAQESSALTRKQIIEQIGASILAQANQQPKLALQLLQS